MSKNEEANRVYARALLGFCVFTSSSQQLRKMSNQNVLLVLDAQSWTHADKLMAVHSATTFRTRDKVCSTCV